MERLIYIGVDKNAKGGVSSVLSEYEKIFPHAVFISTTRAGSFLSNLFCLFVGLIKTLWFAIRARNAVFHIHGSSYKSFHRKYLFFVLLKSFDCKLVYHVHGGGFEAFYAGAKAAHRAKIRSMIEGVDCLICLSDTWASFFKKNFHPKRIEVVKNIVSVREKLFLKNKIDGEMVFLFLGHITESKGAWLLINAAVELKKVNKKFQIIFGGYGESERLLGLISSLDLQEEVLYCGWVSGNEKQKLFEKSSVFVLPSYIEGLPVSILEAMTYELPIIATAVGGVPDIVNDDNGILIEKDDLPSLTQAMKFAIENPEIMLKLGKSGATAVSSHAPQAIKLRLQAIYNSLH